MENSQSSATVASLEVNKFARKNRHLKVFSKFTLLKLHLFDFFGWAFAPYFWFKKSKLFSLLKNAVLFIENALTSFVPEAPQKRLFFNSMAVSAAALVATSVTPTTGTLPIDLPYSMDYMSSYEISGDILVADEDGYLVKINPQTDAASRIGLTDYAVHTVRSGETLSVIASNYEIKMDTIMWENNLSNADSLRIGQKLLVPPVDGVSYKVQENDTLDKIAETYSVAVDDIVIQNGLSSDMLTKGQNLFLPNAKPIHPVVAVDYRNATVTRDSSRTYTPAAPSTSTPSVGKIFIYPTTGSITQGYRAGHYAIDIADNGSMPPIWAAGTGTVEEVSTGTWGGGYGNHVIIDHGGGIKTLYAHLDSVSVSEGDNVSQGDVIGVMGNTGRVYGRTGIHLHWEVIDNGVKSYPGNYY